MTLILSHKIPKAQSSASVKCVLDTEQAINNDSCYCYCYCSRSHGEYLIGFPLCVGEVCRLKQVK